MTFDDQKLRERFAALRREDAAQAPDFARLLSRRSSSRKARPRPSWRVHRFATPIAAAFGVVVVLIVAVALFRFYPFYSRPAAGNLSITQWRSPTDFLLQTPGHELLESVPRVGQWPDGLLLSRPSPTPVGRKKS